ncbi:T9SS type A sorting domain-containing protein [Candidatus Kaistella beijingensis]|uniref:T9SS type A sorting domain-containing protein n=1 Tax=Candidatus Kaistella beijingensis TaxID=2820270 RepID=UPI001CC3CD99|nr:T9SS type A sorting domain-containing protein [Candidatus Kaistella beijingensis]UBB88650.1 T9SS type A sorting domain-containing protein [Candidatus Kaistella beijingensis]
MKKTLLLLAAGLMSAALTAQITLPKTWDFANDTTNWPLNSGTGVADKTIDQLGLFSKADGSIVNFGAITATAYTFSDGYSGPNRLQLNGAGYSSGSFSTTPTQRYLYFDVAGPADVKIWFRSGSNSSARTVFITDGTNILGQATTDTAGTGVIFTGSKTSTGTQRLYVYGDAACNLYKMTVTGSSLGVNTANQNSMKVFASGNLVHINNVKSDASASVYTMNGALVKSVSSKSDFAFDLNPGMYIVNVKSAKGTVSQKVIVK